MAKLVIDATNEINASPQIVYNIIADYHEHHARILPKQFQSLEVTKGGKGAGTEIKVAVKAAGQENHFEMVVTEPEPGLVVLINEIASIGTHPNRANVRDRGNRRQQDHTGAAKDS